MRWKSVRRWRKAGYRNIFRASQAAGSMFTRVECSSALPPGANVLDFEGSQVPFQSGDSVAAALLAAGVSLLRGSPVDESPRAPYCMMGVCFECLVEIDGKQNQQSCLTRARPGMIIRRQHGARTLG
ncbi:(2Fe-2S)-binding protein [Mesorhizobium sp. B1-1-2]|uniref:(2Fe-2S)-binding protein n=2 Tax=unclassified Mesorhizobium TaxID=325217 RepID=UPI0032B309CC